MRTVLTRSSWLIAGLAVLFAATAQAQDAAASAESHTVKRGDTLWDLSRTYLGDPFLWPEIYRINTDVVEDPHWIFPGEVLRIPGREVAQAPPPALTEPDVAEPLVTPVASEPSPATGGATVFASSPFVRRSAVPARRPLPPEPYTAVRPGQYYSAPWLDNRGGPVGSGRLLAPVDILGIAESREQIWLHVHDRAYISLPDGAVATEGDRYLTYRLGTEVTGGRQVVIPTGIVRVTVADNGDATTVRILQQFETVRIGDQLMPLERAVLPVRAPTTPIDLGIEGRILWVSSDVLLPTVQHYVLLDVTSLDGVRLGDMFTIFRPRRALEGHMLPEEEIALAQIVRVNDRGATAMIVDQRHPAIKEGVPARLTRRLP